MTKQPDKCMICERVAADLPVKLRRGICASCYAVVGDQVKRGETTWDELVALGLVAAPLKWKTGKPKAVFLQKLEEARKAKGGAA